MTTISWTLFFCSVVSAIAAVISAIAAIIALSKAHQKRALFAFMLFIIVTILATISYLHWEDRVRLAQLGIDYDGDGKKDVLLPFTGKPKIAVKLAATGKTVQTPLPEGYDPNLSGSVWINGDFNGDGYTDLAHIVEGNVVDPKSQNNKFPSYNYYVHVFLSQRDGTFSPPSKFYFADFANSQHSYDGSGVWETVVCNSKHRADLEHTPPPNMSTPIYWLSVDGVQFKISPTCPAERFALP